MCIIYFYNVHPNPIRRLNTGVKDTIMGIKSEKLAFIILPNGFSVVIGLVFTLMSTTAQAELSREQLHSLVSGINILRDRLIYQRTMLNPDGEERNFTNTGSRFESLVPEEFEVALGYILLVATAEDRDKADHLLQIFKRLDKDTSSYRVTVQRVKRESRYELDAAFRKEIDAFHKERADRLRDFRKKMDASHKERDDNLKGQIGLLGKKPPTPDRQLQKPQALNSTPNCKNQNCISEKIGADRDYGPFPLYAKAPPSLHKKARLTHEDLQSIWFNLDLQYETAFNEIDELLVHFLKQMSSE